MIFPFSVVREMQRDVLSLRFLALASLLVCAAAGEPKGVDVSLRVKWPGTSYLLEAAEYLVSAIAALTFPFLIGKPQARGLRQTLVSLHAYRQLRAQVPSGPLLKPGRIQLVLKQAAGMPSFPVQDSMCPRSWLYLCSRQWLRANTPPRSKCCAISAKQQRYFFLWHDPIC